MFSRSLKLFSQGNFGNLNNNKKFLTLYTKTHEWFDTETYHCGITKFASKNLGELIYIHFDEANIGDIEKGNDVFTVESVKSISFIHSPVSGALLRVNESVELRDVENNPEKTWLFVVHPVDDNFGLLTKEKYDEHCENEVV